MIFFRPRTLALAAAVILAGTPALAQSSSQRPTTEQAQSMMENPALVTQLRQKLLTSGLTPDQIRARLRAEGYPENLLDAYLPGGSGASADSTGASSENVFSALSSLGIADSAEVDLIRCGVNVDSLDARDSANKRSPGDTSSKMSAEKQSLHARCVARLDSIKNSLQRKKAEVDSGFVIFGLDFFRDTNNQFDANLTGPVDAGYRVGPGDKLVLVLTGDVEQSYSLDVTREGFVVIPQVGQVWVNNLTLGELNDVLYSRLGRVYSGVRRGPGATTHFYVTPARLRSNQIFVVGDALHPGSYRVSSAGTALTALYAARGPTDNGSMRNIQIKRGGKTVDVLDVYQYLINGDASHDVRLENGDVIFIPVHQGRVRIVGEVSRPATYEMKEGETLADALRFAGGFSATSSRRRVQIERIVPPTQRVGGGRDRIVTDIVSDEFAAGTGPAIAVQPGDVIRVFPVGSRVRNRIAVKGDVYSPGTQGMTPGMKLSDALKLAGGLKSDAYLGQVLISRLEPDSTRTQLHATLADTTGRVVNDLTLKEDDEITVFSVSDFRPARYVAITGAVRKSGQFPYREGMTVRDLVLLAGGLEQSAYLNEAEVARLPDDRRRGATATTFRVPLDSSYLFERGPDGHYSGPPGLPAPAGSEPEVVVKPYDNILILRQPNWELQRSVAIAGEVKFPGKYSLRTKTEKLTALIQRAGGLTTEAYANGVVFYRKANAIGRIGIELPRVLKDSASLDNLILQDGDSVFIPRYSTIVNVTGAVNSPVAVTYVPGSNLEYYIRAAGGPSRKADVGRAYVTQPNGKVEAGKSHFLLPDFVPKPGPGSTVYVPERDPNQKPIDFVTSAGAIAQILATLVTIVIALRR